MMADSLKNDNRPIVPGSYLEPGQYVKTDTDCIHEKLLLLKACSRHGTRHCNAMPWQLVKAALAAAPAIPWNLVKAALAAAPAIQLNCHCKALNSAQSQQAYIKGQ